MTSLICYYKSSHVTWSFSSLTSLTCTATFVWISGLYLIFIQLVSIFIFMTIFQMTIWFVYKIMWRRTSCLLRDLVFSVCSACGDAFVYLRPRRCQHPCVMLCQTRLLKFRWYVLRAIFLWQPTPFTCRVLCGQYATLWQNVPQAKLCRYCQKTCTRNKMVMEDTDARKIWSRSVSYSTCYYDTLSVHCAGPSFIR
jgi:hypothetical protein